jgi:endoglucanase
MQSAIAALVIPARYSSAASGMKPRMRVAGINLAGAEFGDKLPGVYGRDYQYPPLHVIEHYRSLGLNLVRLPFRWERLQPELGGSFSPKEEKHLVGLSHYLGERHMMMVLDPHNYAHRKLSGDGWQSSHLIGSPEVPTLAFVDFWSRLASLFKGHGNVIFGLMNEPYGLASEAWLDIVNHVIAGIRGRGAANLVLVPGVAYSGAHSWISAGNGVLERVKDPAHNFAFDVHQYLDEDSSGTHPNAVSPTVGSERIRAFEDWARKRRMRGFLGEFGASEDETSQLALADLCRSLLESPDVWFGWAAWAGGPLWPANYMFNLEPHPDGKDRPQMMILASYAGKMSHFH